MTIRRFGEHTQREYVRQVSEFTAFLSLPPDQAEPEDLRRDQLHLALLGASYARMNQACTALRLFFHVTLGRTGFGDRIARIPTPGRLPVVLDTQEVALRLAHAPSLKDRAAHHPRRQDRRLMTRAPRPHPEEPLPVSVRERAIPFGPMTKVEIAAVTDPSNVQPNSGSRASRSEHRTAAPHLARTRRSRRAAKSP